MTGVQTCALPILISFLAFLFVRSVERTKDKAIVIANEMTSALRESETAVKKINRSLRMIGLCNEKLTKSKNDLEFVQNVCRIAVNDGGYLLAWVGKAEKDEQKTVSVLAQEGLIDLHLDQVRVTYGDGPTGKGPTSEAIRTGTPIVLRDLDAPDYHHRNPEAEKLGYKSVVALPLFVEGEIFGALTLYSSNPNDFEQDDIQLLKELASDLGLGIATIHAHALAERSREALQRSEAFLEQIVENIPAMIFVKDAEELRFVRFNKAGEELLGFSSNDMIGKNDHDLFPRDQAEFFTTKDRQVLKDKKLVEIPEEQIDTKNRGKRILRTKKIPILDSHGAPQFLLGISEDVTESIQRETELRQFKAIADNSSYGHAISDLKGNLIYLNNSWARMHGFTISECEGQNLHIFHTPEQMTKIGRSIERLMTHGEFESWELWHKRKDGTVFPTVMSGVAIPDDAGTPRFLSATIIDISGLKEIENDLRESEDRFRTAFLTSPDAVTISRLDESGEGFYVDVNIGFCELTGYRPEEVLGKSSSEINIWSNPDDKYRLLSALQREGQVTNLQLQFRLKDGTLRTGLVSARMISLGEKPHILTVTRDVEDWKRAEDSLRRSEERFSQVTEIAGEWIWEVDQNGLYLYCSSAVLEILGYLQEEIVDQRLFWELLAPSEQQTSAITPLEVFEKKQTFKGLVSNHIHKDGRVVIIETSGTPVFDEKGNFAGYRGTNTDITQRVKASESLELLAAVVEHASESIVVTDLTGKIKYVNPAFEHICGYSEQEAIGANPRILKSGKQPDRFYADLWNTISKGEIWRGHFVNKKKDGSFFEEDATISPLKDSSGQIANYVAVKRDVTREVLLQNQLVQAQKMEAIGTLAGGIAHDFNNILFAIIGYTEMAIDDQAPGSRSLRDLEQVLSAAKRAADMVKQILTFSRQTEPQRVMLDLTPIVKEGLKFLRGSIPSTIEIRQKIGSLTGKIEADPTQMHQVLMNLCSNAAQAMKDTTGVMTVELAEITLDEPYSSRHLALKPGRYVKLSVSDTGYGIPPENIDRIFEPYFTTKGIGEGTGLGLAVIHGIVSSHGGTITVYSIPGQGSTFNVFLPFAEGDFECEGASDSCPIPKGKERILFVDDEEILLEMGQAILERLGYRVVAFLDPLKALEAFRTDPGGFDLVLTDLMMPKVTGLVLAEQIKIMNPDVPIILCTGFGHKFTTEEAEGNVFSGILSKPISKKDIALTVRKALDMQLKSGELTS